jgi:hypothetical protein
MSCNRARKQLSKCPADSRGWLRTLEPRPQ